MNEHTYWLRQDGKPLYPDAIWAKPERKTQAGKLLIIGGNGLEFKETQTAYGWSLDKGIGECKVVLPKSAQKVLGAHPDIEFTEATSHGGFSLNSKADLLAYMDWPDTILLPGELGKNSETTQVLEHIVRSTDKRIVLVRDSIDLLKADYKTLLERDETTLVLTLTQLQEIFKAISWPQPIRSQMSLGELTDQLHKFTNKYSVNIVTCFARNLISASAGDVASTRLAGEPESWQLEVAVSSANWLTWTNPGQALATACWQFKE